MRIMTEQECSLVEAHMALVETVIRRHITVRLHHPVARRTVRRAQQRGGHLGEPGKADAEKGSYSVCRIKPPSPSRSFSAAAYGFFFR